MKKQTKLIGKRNEAGFTQQEVADALGITRVSYSAKENGSVGFLLTESIAVLKLLKTRLKNITIDDVFDFEN